MTRRWQHDTLAVRDNIFDTPCRVCGGAIAKGEKVHGFAWREERGRAHEQCGFYNLNDAEAVACARQLMARTGQTIPRSLTDEGVMLYLVRRVHQVGVHGERVLPTTIGVALFERIRKHDSRAA